MSDDIIKGDMSLITIQHFFDPLGTVVVEAKRKDVNGQCTKKDNNCKGSAIYDSRYNDMKVSMYLLGNAFRTDQQKPPDRLRKFMKYFFQKVLIIYFISPHYAYFFFSTSVSTYDLLISLTFCMICLNL